MYTREQMDAANRKSGSGSSWAGRKGRWSSVTYMNEKFRQVVATFEQEQNLSRFIWRTAKMQGMKDLTLADETIFVIRGDKDGKREFDGNNRKPTWVMQFSRKQMWAAMMTIENAGCAESYKREIQIQGETREQRIWTLA